MAAEKKTENNSESKTKNTYTKDQILTSEKYAKRRDLVNALLEDDKEYIIMDVDAMMEKFLKGKVTG